MFSNSLRRFFIVAQLTFIFRKILFLCCQRARILYLWGRILLIGVFYIVFYTGCCDIDTSLLNFPLLHDLYSHRQPVSSCLIWRFARFRHVNMYCFKHLETFASLDLLTERKFSVNLLSAIVSSGFL